MPTLQWIRSVLAGGGGRLEEFEAFYDEMLPVVYRYLALRAGPSIAEELTGDIFCSAFRRFQSAGPQSMNAPWIMAVTKNKLIDHWRRNDRRGKLAHLVEVNPDDLVADSAELIALEDSSKALATLEKLPPRYRILLTLRYIDDMTVADVARSAGISESAAESALARARRA